MQTYTLLAGSLALLVGLIHSVLGEVLIFRGLRDGGIVPTQGGGVLKERYVRILWASWHIVSVFGWGFAAILLRLSFPSTEPELLGFVKNTIAIAMLTSAALVLVGTRGRHPGWLGLLVVAVLSWLA